MENSWPFDIESGLVHGVADGYGGVDVAAEGFRAFGQDSAILLGEEQLGVDIAGGQKADPVAEAHLHQALGNAAAGDGPGGSDLARLAKGMELAPAGADGFKGIVSGAEEGKRRGWRP